MLKKITFILISSILFISTIGAEDRLEATIIGSGSPSYNVDRASASVLITLGETNILVDMGNGTQANLNKLGVKTNSFSALIFTHHHLDHNEEFPPMLINSLLGRQQFEIIGPINTNKFVEYNLELYKDDISYRLDKSKRTIDDRKNAFIIKEIQGGESFNIGKIRVTTTPVPHSIETIAYRFDYKNQSIVVSGDLTYTENLSKLAKDADYLIIDSGGVIMEGSQKRTTSKATTENNTNTGSKRKDGITPAHVNLEQSSKMAGEANVTTMVFTHFLNGTINEEATISEVAKNFKGDVIFAYDLMKFSTK